MTPDQIRWLTWGAIQHRPSGAPRWDEPGTAKAITDHCGTWGLEIATEHVLAHARDPKARTHPSPSKATGRTTNPQGVPGSLPARARSAPTTTASTTAHVELARRTSWPATPLPPDLPKLPRRLAPTSRRRTD